jgi:arginase
MRRVALIGAASGWGAGFGETEGGPAALRDMGLARWLGALGIGAAWQAMVSSELRWREHPDLRGAACFELVARHAAALSDAVAEAMAGGRLPVVLGGDHAVAMGSWGGVWRGMGRQPLGLVWLDAHLDAHTPATTPSMNAHGMSAAALLGHGHPAFLTICGGALRPENLCYIGVRSYEAEEMALLRSLGVRVVLMPEVKARGLADVLAEAQAIATRGTAGFGVTIDLDGFDPADAPGVGLREPDGLRAEATCAALRRLAGHPALQAVEIVEYIPEFDEDRRTAHLVRDLLAALLAPEKALVAAAATDAMSSRATAAVLSRPEDSAEQTESAAFP